MITLIVWIVLLIAFGIYWLAMPVGRSQFRVLKRFILLRIGFKKRRFFLGTTLIVVIAFLVSIIYVQYVFTQKEMEQQWKANVLSDFAFHEIRGKALDSVIFLPESLGYFRPELAMVLPTVVKAIREASGTNVIPVLQNEPDSLSFSLRIIGYRSFKNRGIRARKLVQKRLGKNYVVTFEEIIKKRKAGILTVRYVGKPFDTERLFALPVALAAKRENLLAEYLMAFYAADPRRKNFDTLNVATLDSTAKLLHQVVLSESIGFSEQAFYADSARVFQLFKTAYQQALSPFQNFSEIDVYAQSAMRFLTYYKKYGF